MFTIEKLIELEKPLIDADLSYKYYKMEDIPTTAQLIKNYRKYILKEGREPIRRLEDIIPILLYKSPYRGDFYSKLVNLNNDGATGCTKEIKLYFRDWLKFALNNIPSFSGEVAHRINPKDLESSETLAMDFERNIGSQILFRKFISTSELEREHNFRFDIKTRARNSASKEIWNIFYEESELGDREVLFNINTTFKILNVRKVGGIWIVSLEEVLPNSISPARVLHKLH